MYFQYDTSGTPLGFIYNGTQYLYLTDQMGDVIAITDADGGIIAAYVYDAWGKLLNINYLDEENSEHNKIVNATPLRYRGYYYDNETGYYYLQSRYYDPSICRFINADVPEIANISKGVLSGINLFVYCNNNSVNNVDYDGFWAEKIPYKYYKYGYYLKVSKKFLSRPYCLSFAKDIIKNSDRVTNYGYSRIKGIAFGMNAKRMAVEIWFHVIVYYGGKPLAKICKRFKSEIWSHANPIDVNKNEKSYRVAAYYSVWAAASSIKRTMRLSGFPALIKLAAYIIL